MTWLVELHSKFVGEFQALPEAVQDVLLAKLELLEEFGPRLGRPHVDTLNASKFSNMKELRFDSDGDVWRAAFAFDPERRAIVLVAGEKTGISQGLFYRRLIEKADARYRQHLKELEGKD
ncbi:MAG: addiction module toxin RelE [Symploca sp. SIO2G7]|nr:addiction module toxin RelE [Symploca sp. SIO2G7]